SYPDLTLTVAVAGNAAASVTNTATVSGGGETNTGNDSASDPTTITQLPDLTITKSHSGAFSQEDSADTYTISVSNTGGGATSSPPSVFTLICAHTTLTNVAFASSPAPPTSPPSSHTPIPVASYPDLTFTVAVAGNAPASVTNTATVSGGGETNTGNDSASD